MSPCHSKYTFHTIYPSSHLRLQGKFSQKALQHYSSNFATIWPTYGKSLLFLFFIEGGTRWDVTGEKLSSRRPGLRHTSTSLSLTFFKITEHWVWVGRWLKTVQPGLPNCQEMKTPTWEAGEKRLVTAAAQEWGSNLAVFYLPCIRVTSSALLLLMLKWV